MADKKCYIRNYIYSDGSKKTFHTVCDAWELPEESDKYGRELEPEKTLVEVKDEVHNVN